MRHSPEPFVHLVHPRPIQWESVISAVQKDLNLPLVPYGQWLASLERVKADPGSQDENELITRYPALKILEFFADAGKESASSEAMGMPMLESTNAQQCSKTLKNMQPLSDADVLSWISYWRRVKFIS